MEKKNLWETEWKMPLEPRLKILENICQCCTVKESQICTPILYSLAMASICMNVYTMDGIK